MKWAAFRRLSLPLLAAFTPATAFGKEKSKGVNASVGQPPKFEQILKIDIHSHIFEEIPALIEMMLRKVKMIKRSAK